MNEMRSEAERHLGWKTLLITAGIFTLGMTILSTADTVPDYRAEMNQGVSADTVTVEGQVVVVGSDPFTRMRLVEKGGGGYILSFEDDDTINLRRKGPTEVRIVGVSYRDVWQGEETSHLRVLRWEYANQ